MKIRAYLALVHHPILNKRGDIVTTPVTNLDIHDLARSARTFGFLRYFIVTPVLAQQALVNKIIGHWGEDQANQYNPDRSDALASVQVVESLEAATQEVERREGIRPATVVTGANFKEDDGDAHAVKSRLQLDNRPMLLIFGTGWGLPASLVQAADYRLGPIYGAAEDGYNHLSVRSAVAIYSDRFFGRSL